MKESGTIASCGMHKKRSVDLFATTAVSHKTPNSPLRKTDSPEQVTMGTICELLRTDGKYCIQFTLILPST